MVPWLIAEFRPGWSDDLTSWRTEIHRTGELSQKVHICRLTPREEGTLHHKCEITPQQIQELERLVAVIDYAAVAKALSKDVISDAAYIEIIVNASAATRIQGSILGWDLVPQENPLTFNRAMANALRLWQAIDRLSPHRLNSALQ
jgi:hypothetical protein